MADISKIDNGTEYNLKDATARAGIESSKTLKSSVVTVPDAAAINAEDITVDITPKQDLHGYDKPWAGGAGKNKLPYPYYESSLTRDGVTFTIQNDGTVIVSGTATASVFFIIANKATLDSIGSGDYILNGCPQGGATDGSTYFLGFYAPEKSKRDFGSGTTISLSGNENVNANVYIRINNGYTANNLLFKPMIRLAAETDATFTPYSNECPIGGWTGAELDRVGKNLAAGIENGSWSTITQQKYGNIQRARVSNIIRVIPSETYTFNIDTQDGYITYARIAVYPELNRSAIYTTDWLEVPCSYTIPSGGKYVTIEYGFTVPTNHPELYTSNAQFELGSTATAYEPYQGQKYTADFGETVHGGKWHVTAGGTDKTHGNIASYNGETINEPWLSSLDKYVAGATPTTGAQVVYPLTTPTTISTPKQNVPMLQGINTVSADCGDTQLKYQPDNVIGELKGEIEDVIDYAEPKFVNYSSYPHDTDPETAFGVNVRLRRDRGYVSIENVALTFWQNYPIADFYYEIQNPVPTEFIPEYDVEKLFLHINGQSFLNVILTNTGILKLRMYSPVRIVDNYPNVFWLQSADETGCKDAKY